MKLKNSYLYQLAQIKTSLLGFYTIILAVCFLMVLVLIFQSANEDLGSFTGFGFANMIFLFGFFGGSFKPEFLMLTQNGISRKTFMQTKILTLISIAFLVTVADMLIESLLKEVFTWSNSNMKLSTLVEQLFPLVFEQLNFFYSLLINFSIFLAIASFGGNLGIFLYRLSKKGILIVFVGFTIAISAMAAVDVAFLDRSITIACTQFIDFAFGISAGKPINWLITCFCIFLLSNGCSYLLIRKTPVKE